MRRDNTRSISVRRALGKDESPLPLKASRLSTIPEVPEQWSGQHVQHTHERSGWSLPAQPDQLAHQTSASRLRDNVGIRTCLPTYLPAHPRPNP